MEQEQKCYENTSIFDGWREFLAEDGETYRVELDDCIHKVFKQQRDGSFISCVGIRSNGKTCRALYSAICRAERRQFGDCE